MMNNSMGVACIITWVLAILPEVTKLHSVLHRTVAQGCWLSAAHIPGMSDTLADRESRLDSRYIEWNLNSA